MANPNLEFNSNTHEYWYKNRLTRSVTQILGLISEREYKYIDEDVLNAKAQIGTNVHRDIELYSLYGIKLMPRNEREKNYFNSYLKFREDYKDHFKKTLFAEFQEVYDSDLDSKAKVKMKFGGQIDNISLFDDGITMIDYKTVAVANEPKIALQLYGYKLIANLKIPNLKITKFKTLLLREDGYELIDLTHLVNDEKTEKLFNYFYEFMQLLDEYGIENQALKYDDDKF